MASAHAIPMAGPRRGLRSWFVSAVATAASTYALDVIAAAAGVGLVSSGLLSGLSHRWILVFLIVSYAMWAAGLRANLRANADLLAATGTSTNVLSKAAHDLARRITDNPRAARLAASATWLASSRASPA